MLMYQDHFPELGLSELLRYFPRCLFFQDDFSNLFLVWINRLEKKNGRNYENIRVYRINERVTLAMNF